MTLIHGLSAIFAALALGQLEKKMRFVIATHDRSTWECIGWVPNLTDKPHEADLVEMPPLDFLREVDPGYLSHLRPKSIEFLMAAAEEGRCFAPLQMWPNSARYKGVLEHEGRNRAYVASLLGMRTVPVMRWRK